MNVSLLKQGEPAEKCKTPFPPREKWAASCNAKFEYFSEYMQRTKHGETCHSRKSAHLSEARPDASFPWNILPGKQTLLLGSTGHRVFTPASGSQGL